MSSDPLMMVACILFFLAAIPLPTQGFSLGWLGAFFAALSVLV